MRILMVSQFYAPVVGGVERAVEDLATALTRRGHSVAVATLGHDGLPPFEIVGGVRIHRIRSLLQGAPWIYADPERPHVPPAPDPRAVAGLRRVIGTERPDIVHAHDWLVHSLVAIRRGARFPLVLSLHDYGLVCANKRLMRGDEPCDGPSLGKCLRCAGRQYGVVKGVATATVLRARRGALLSSVDRLLPVSGAVVERAGVVGSGVAWEIVPNLLTDATLRFAETSGREAAVADGLPADGFLLYVGDLVRDKGIEVLLDAHRRLGGKPPLVLVGRDMTGIGERALPAVHTRGTLGHAAVLDAMRRCSTLVAPSLCAETFGIGVLEGMAMAKPVVAARAGALTEIVVDGENGLLTPPGDADALASAVASLLADARGRRRMGAAARVTAESYGEDIVTPQVERIYNAVAGRSRERPRARSEARPIGPAG